MPEHTLTGNIQRHARFESRILKNRRDVLVYLPRGYRCSIVKRYPVLYLQDGQNLFDAATAFAGVEWGVDETAQRLIGSKLIEPLIIVAIDNAGKDRVHEYAPTRGLIEELKPFIDRKYRTRRDAPSTGVGGSSLAGLLTMCVGLWYPHIFSRLLVMSPSVWWDDVVILKMAEELERKLPLKIWLDTGTAEPGWQNTRKLRDLLVEKGWRLDDDLQYTEDDKASHTEAAWGSRVDPALRFLFPAQIPLRLGQRRPKPPLVLERQF
jgi:predicted alpha/beta superfamily hydrolase